MLSWSALRFAVTAAKCRLSATKKVTNLNLGGIAFGDPLIAAILRETVFVLLRLLRNSEISIFASNTSKSPDQSFDSPGDSEKLQLLDISLVSKMFSLSLTDSSHCLYTSSRYSRLGN